MCCKIAFRSQPPTGSQSWLLYPGASFRHLEFHPSRLHHTKLSLIRHNIQTTIPSDAGVTKRRQSTDKMNFIPPVIKSFWYKFLLILVLSKSYCWSEYSLIRVLDDVTRRFFYPDRNVERVINHPPWDYSSVYCFITLMLSACTWGQIR